jgi:hypothetical protein
MVMVNCGRFFVVAIALVGSSACQSVPTVTFSDTGDGGAVTPPSDGSVENDSGDGSSGESLDARTDGPSTNVDSGGGSLTCPASLKPGTDAKCCGTLWCQGNCGSSEICRQCRDRCNDDEVCCPKNGSDDGVECRSGSCQ